MKKTEKGQILVLLTLAIIGLLGITALAIDGSMIYADRRFTQSVADSASLAGGNAIKEQFSDGIFSDANFSCSSVISVAESGMKAAINRTSDYYSEIVTPDTISDPYSPLTLGSHKFLVTCDLGNKSLIVIVELTSQTNTAFIQVISPIVARNTVHAETEVVANRSLTGGYGIISVSQLCKNNEGGTYFSGTPLIKVQKGGACSNSCMYTGGTSLEIESEGPINYDPVNGWSSPGNPIVNPTPSPINNDCIDPDPFQQIFIDLETACANMDPGVEVVEASGQRTFYQGKFTNLEQSNDKEPMNFEPGLYCLTRTGNKPSLKINGGSVNAQDVTFVILEGDVEIAGNAGDDDPITLRAPMDTDNDGAMDSGNTNADTGLCVNGNNEQPYVTPGTCPSGFSPKAEVTNLAEIPFLFYVTDWGGNKAPILSLLGTSSSAYDGIIYAPTTLVTIGGTSSTVTAEFGTTIIGYDVRVFGGAEVNVIAMDDGIPAVSGWLDFLK